MVYVYSGHCHIKADGLEIFQDALRRWLYPSTRSVASVVRELNLTASHDLLVYKLWMERVISDVFQKFEFLSIVQPVAAKITLMTFLQIKVELFICWWECLNTDRRVLLQTYYFWDQIGLNVYLFLCPQVRGSMNLTDVLSPCQPKSQVEVNLNHPVRRWHLCPNPSSTGWVTRNNAHTQHCCWKVVFVPFFIFNLIFSCCNLFFYLEIAA